jgi:hypothetical protein
VVGYFAFLVAHAFYNEVVLHYMVAGHTHFSPDRVFGWLGGQLKDTDIFDMEDVLKILNTPPLAPKYSGVELKPSDFSRWTDLVSGTIKKCKGIRSWHWIRLSRSEEDQQVVLLQAKKSSSDELPFYERTIPCTNFPDMTLETHEARDIPPDVTKALNFAKTHIGGRSFRYL